LKEKAARRFIERAFRDGTLKKTGTDIDKIMPAVSRFGDEDRTLKKQSIIDKLSAFFEKYFGLV
jgi:type I restriction enzyme R subunit